MNKLRREPRRKVINFLLHNVHWAFINYFPDKIFGIAIIFFYNFLKLYIFNKLFYYLVLTMEYR